jgi:hypothetical protein
MREIAQVETSSELERITSLMHDNGVPTYSRSAGSYFGGSPWIIYACLDSQGDDAAKLLTDPSHEIASPVDVDAFDFAASRSNTGLMLWWSVGLIAVVAGALALVLYFSSR